jgi:hypothetical protein
MANLIEIKYGAQSRLSRWFAEYWTERDKQAMPWLITLILLVFLYYGPTILIRLASFLPLDQLGNSGASIRAHMALVAVATLLTIVVCAIFARLLLKPKFIALSPDGLSKGWRLGLFTINGKTFAWDNIETIQLVRDGALMNSQSARIKLVTKEAADDLILPLHEFDNEEDRQKLYQGFVRWLDKARIAPEIAEALKPHRELSFAALWLESMAVPPHREQLLPLAEGTLLGTRFRVIEKLQQKSESSLYLAEDLDDNQQLVLQESMLPVFADNASKKQAAEDFQTAVARLKAISHPGIVSVKDSLILNQRAFLLLPYIREQTLEEKVNTNGRLTIEETIDLGIQMCDILATLHELTPPLLHRQLTPNILITTKEGELILSSLSIATREREDDSESLDATSITPYTAPEQLKGKPTVRSDVYSAGGIMHFCLTGKHPDSITECHPTLLRDAVPIALSDVIAHATRYDAAERIPDANTLRASLEVLKQAR